MPLLEQVLERNKETVKIVFKNLPLAMHDQAKAAAFAALAAGRQGKYWEYHDLLFAEKPITGESYEKIAGTLGLDMKKFWEDMKSAPLIKLVQDDMAEARQLGVTGTPTIFINGRNLKDRSLAGFQALIDKELEKLKPEAAASGN